MDYLFPDWATKILKAPSERTSMESSMVGILVMMLGSLGLVSYLIINGIISGFWYIFLTISSELGILSFQFSLLSTTYQTYFQYKMMNNLYPKDYVLQQKIEEAKRIKEELDKSIKDNEVNTLIKSNKEEVK
jgi:hypothetical protein